MNRYALSIDNLALLDAVGEERATDIFEKNQSVLKSKLVKTLIDDLVRDMNEHATDAFLPLIREENIDMQCVPVHFSSHVRERVFFRTALSKQETTLLDQDLAKLSAEELLPFIEGLYARGEALVSEQVDLFRRVSAAAEDAIRQVAHSSAIGLLTTSRMTLSPSDDPLRVNLSCSVEPERFGYWSHKGVRFRLKSLSSPLLTEKRVATPMSILKTSLHQWVFFAEDILRSGFADRLESKVYEHLVGHGLPLRGTDGVRVVTDLGFKPTLTVENGRPTFHLPLNATDTMFASAERLARALSVFRGMDDRMGRILSRYGWVEGNPNGRGLLVLSFDISDADIVTLVQDLVTKQEDVLRADASDKAPERVPLGFDREYFVRQNSSFTHDGHLYRHLDYKGERRQRHSRFFRDGERISRQAFFKAVSRHEQEILDGREPTDRFLVGLTDEDFPGYILKENMRVSDMEREDLKGDEVSLVDPTSSGEGIFIKNDTALPIPPDWFIWALYQDYGVKHPPRTLRSLYLGSPLRSHSPEKDEVEEQHLRVAVILSHLGQGTVEECFRSLRGSETKEE